MLCRALPDALLANLLLTIRGGEKFPDPGGVHGTGGAEGPAERGSAFSLIEAPLVGMQMCTPARRPSTRIGDENVLDRYDS